VFNHVEWLVSKGTYFLFFFAEDGYVETVVCNNMRIEVLHVTQEKTPSIESDRVGIYARNILNLGLFSMVLHDMVQKPKREDALSILRVAMLYFKAANSRSKYANEVLRLLVHQMSLLSKEEAELEFKGLFVNTKGRYDTNIATDLQMEYIVKEVKKHIKHMHSGQTEHNIQVHSRAISGLSAIGDHFDDASGVIIRSTRHKQLSDDNDVLCLVDDLSDMQLYVNHPGRCHKSFASITPNVANDIDATKLHKWLYDRAKVYSKEFGN